MSGGRVGLRIRGLVVAAGLVVGLGACTPAGDAGDGGAGDAADGVILPTPSSKPVFDDSPEFVGAAEELVEDRLAALRSRDRKAFLGTLDPANTEFTKRQQAYFDNLGDLPVQRVDLTVEPGGVPMTVHRRGATQLVVRTSLQLRGYDAEPVVTEDLYTFEKVDGSPRLTDDRDLSFDSLHGFVPTPWDLGPVTVREQGGALVVFDGGTEDDAEEVTGQVADALAAVDRVVPPWRDRVIVYDIDDPALLDKMSLMTVENTAGLAFGVYADPDHRKLAAMRFLVNPDTDTESGSEFVYRHELTHVALSERDDGSPVWLREGVADYTAAQGLPGEQRRALRSVLAGRAAGLRDLPDGRKFYQVEPRKSYALAFLVCDWIADQHGSEELWRLMDAMTRASPTFDDDVDRVVRRELGLDTRQLTATALAWST